MVGDQYNDPLKPLILKGFIGLHTFLQSLLSSQLVLRRHKNGNTFALTLTYGILFQRHLQIPPTSTLPVQCDLVKTILSKIISLINYLS